MSHDGKPEMDCCQKASNLFEIVYHSSLLLKSFSAPMNSSGVIYANQKIQQIMAIVKQIPQELRNIMTEAQNIYTHGVTHMALLSATERYVVNIVIIRTNLLKNINNFNNYYQVNDGFIAVDRTRNRSLVNQIKVRNGKKRFANKSPTNSTWKTHSNPFDSLPELTLD